MKRCTSIYNNKPRNAAFKQPICDEPDVVIPPLLPVVQAQHAANVVDHVLLPNGAGGYHMSHLPKEVTKGVIIDVMDPRLPCVYNVLRLPMNMCIRPSPVCMTNDILRTSPLLQPVALPGYFGLDPCPALSPFGFVCSPLFNLNADEALNLLSSTFGSYTAPDVTSEATTVRVLLRGTSGTYGRARGKVQVACFGGGKDAFHHFTPPLEDTFGDTRTFTKEMSDEKFEDPALFLQRRIIDGLYTNLVSVAHPTTYFAPFYTTLSKAPSERVTVMSVPYVPNAHRHSNQQQAIRMLSSTFPQDAKHIREMVSDPSVVMTVVVRLENAQVISAAISTMSQDNGERMLSVLFVTVLSRWTTKGAGRAHVEWLVGQMRLIDANVFTQSTPKAFGFWSKFCTFSHEACTFNYNYSKLGFQETYKV